MATVPIVTEILYADLVTLIGNNELQEGLQYNITDRGIRLTAISSNQFNPDGLRKMLCPANYTIGNDNTYTLNYTNPSGSFFPTEILTFNNGATASVYSNNGGNSLTITHVVGNIAEALSFEGDWEMATATVDSIITISENNNNWLGVWNPSLTPTADDLAIWGGLVWKNLTGAVGTKVDYFGLDLTNWVVIPKETFTNGEYVSLIFNVNYDIINDWVNRQWDGAGNIFGMNKSTFIAYFSLEGDSPINLIDACDWNYSYPGRPFHSNTCYFVFNNSNSGKIDSNRNLGLIYENYNDGDISFNENAGDISGNNNSGSIISNSNRGNIINNSNTNIIQNLNNGQIRGNSNSGSIENNYNDGAIYNNSINGSIYQNRNVGYINNCSSIDNAAIDINQNINNGEITGSWGTNVTDTAVDKIGTA